MFTYMCIYIIYDVVNGIIYNLFHLAGYNGEQIISTEHVKARLRNVEAKMIGWSSQE